MLNDVKNVIETITPVLSLLFIAASGMFALHQWCVSNKIKRADFVNQIIEKLRFDKNMLNAIYEIHEKNRGQEKWYSEKF